MTDTAKKATWLAAGLVAGGLAVYALLSQGADDDDRPPIIVRGGSLIFESGSDKSERPRKRWDSENANEYFQDYKKGKDVNWFQLYFVGGLLGGQAGVPCPSVTVRDFTVRFDHDGDGENLRSYTINIRSMGGKSAVPTISGPELNRTSDYVLTAPATPAEIKLINRVSAANGFECHEPTEVWAESVKNRP